MLLPVTRAFRPLLAEGLTYERATFAAAKYDASLPEKKRDFSAA